MNPKVKRILSILFIAVSVSVVVIIAFSNKEMGNAWEAISRLDLHWIGGLFLCWLVYAMLEAAGTWNCLRRRGCKISLIKVFWTVLIGAIAVLGVFAAVQLRMEHPLIEVRTFAHSGFTLGMLILLYLILAIYYLISLI